MTGTTPQKRPNSGKIERRPRDPALYRALTKQNEHTKLSTEWGFSGKHKAVGLCLDDAFLSRASALIAAPRA
jgi:hypothetical protein